MSQMQKLRLEAGLSQSQLGELCGLNQVRISKLETGGINVAEIPTVLKVAKALRVTIEELLDVEEE